MLCGTEKKTTSQALDGPEADSPRTQARPLSPSPACAPHTPMPTLSLFLGRKAQNRLLTSLSALPWDAVRPSFWGSPPPPPDRAQFHFQYHFSSSFWKLSLRLSDLTKAKCQEETESRYQPRFSVSKPVLLLHLNLCPTLPSGQGAGFYSPPEF